MTLNIDGHSTGTWSTGTTFTDSGLTTTSSNDVIVAFIAMQGTISFPLVFGLSTTGVSWVGNRLSSSDGGKNIVVEWYGVAASPLSNQVTTITTAVTPLVAGSVSIFGISGAAFAAVYDANGNLPRTNFFTTTSVPSLNLVSTNNADDMIISAVGTTTAISETAGAGFNLIDAVNNGVASLATQYQIVSATQSNATVSFGSSTTQWIMIVDAVMANANVFGGGKVFI